MFRSNPLLGVGYGGYQPWLAQSYYYMQTTKHIVYSHNSYILVLAELGIIGLAMLLVLLGTCIFLGMRGVVRAPTRDLRMRQSGIVAAIVANIVFLASYDSILYNLSLWIALGMTIALARIIDLEREAGLVSAEEGPSNGGSPNA